MVKVIALHLSIDESRDFFIYAISLSGFVA